MERIYVKIMTGLLSMICCAGVSAQNLASANLEQLVQRETDSMALHLSLTELQKESVSVIQRSYYDSVLALPTTISVDERGVRLDSLNGRRDRALQQALTPMQWQAHQAYLEQRRLAVQQAIEERRNRHHHP